MSTNPNTVKSQDDINEEELGRTMTLLRAIEQLEKTECELEKVEKQLDIAVKALEDVATFMTCDEVEIQEIQPEFCADQAALDRVNEAMKKIKELDK